MTDTKKTDTKAPVAFIGVGKMGAHMAGHILSTLVLRTEFHAMIVLALSAVPFVRRYSWHSGDRY
jgi:hypothetical protein